MNPAKITVSPDNLERRIFWRFLMVRGAVSIQTWDLVQHVQALFAALEN
jgi:hypothetical protein